MSEINDKDLQVLRLEKESALEWRKRRHPDWTDIYTLYRDKVITDRVTQRQTINIPLMKYILNTILKNLDETPSLYFSSLDNKHQQEVYYNEYWKEMAKRSKLSMKDTIDKKQGCLFGRTFKKINIEDGKVTFEIVDPQDMLVHRYVDPSDIHSSPFIAQTGIYRTLREILDNEDYDKGGREELHHYFLQENHTLEQEETFELKQERAERMQAMGVTDVTDPILGETYVELNEIYRYEESKLVKNENVIWKYVVASTAHGMFKLAKDELHDLIGPTSDNFWYNHTIYSTWGADPERTDFWCDGPADIIKQVNIVLNTWISQLVENRTLKNFNMHYYDSSDAKFIPQTFEAVPWGWYPVPGKPADVVQTVEVGDLSESLEEIQFLISIAEKATAATAAQTGSVEQRQVTLGEVQLALANAEQRIKSVEKYINESWEDFGTLYMKMLEGANEMLDPLEIHKRGRQGKKMYTKLIGPSDWITKKGYTIEVRTTSDKQAEDLDSIQKLDAAMASMPGNQPLTDIKNRKLLEFAGLTPEDMNSVLEFQKQQETMTMGMVSGAAMGVQTPVVAPAATPAPIGSTGVPNAA
jgi:hypothetical protein